MKVVIVESPAKAKTIHKYLGPDYTVVASYGHVSDLPAKDGSVRPDSDFAMDWETDPKSEKHVREIVSAVKGAEGLFLATDPDREGEAISWHIRRVLEDRKALKGVPVKRVVFHEITRNAVEEAMLHPRDLDQELVDAYLARRALDYLVGFTLSPVLWRKLPGSRSAGRVQSVALRLICDREAEIELFKSQEYWSIAADFLTPRKELVTASLTHLDGTKLDKLDLKNEDAAKAAEAKIVAQTYGVGKVEKKQARRNPYPPFTTSTLQQEASRKLGLSASRTMQIAQRLYEGIDIGGETVGVITYMRTDGVQMAAEAVSAIRDMIGKSYGDSYVPKAPRIYKNKTKNAQEAHEAIRPTDILRKPDDIGQHLDRDQRRLYELIWRRAVASQMESAVLDQVAADIVSKDKAITFRATGSVVRFDGFLRLYKEDRDEPSETDGDESDRLLPRMDEADAMDRKDVRSDQHFTQPPPRFTEASLVKKMEELGIGRPSTYASILTVLQDRDYVRLEQRRFVPEDRGRVVTAFLENFFNRYVQYDFTANLEEELDDVADGKINWKKVMRDFWGPFSSAVDGTKELRVSEVLDTLDKELGPHFFPQSENGPDPRLCPTCGTGRLSLKLGKFGAFIGCSNYPECRHTQKLTAATDKSGDESGEGGGDSGPRLLGTDPETGFPVALKKGPYGDYVQLGEAVAGEKTKPKRVSLPRGTEASQMNLDKALKLLALPRTIGNHPESGQPIIAGLGRFGSYLKHGDLYKSIPRGDDVLEIGLNRAVDLLADAKGTRKSAQPLGKHPKDGKPILLGSGRFGPYVSHAGLYANLPKGQEQVSLEEAVSLLDAKAARTGATGKAAKTRKAAAKAPARAKAAPVRRTRKA
jgi:DNA topoisomerase-1